MTQSHLRSVPDDFAEPTAEPKSATASGSTGAPVPPAAGRPNARTRARKSLPTDRLKFEAQIELLQRFGRISGSQKRLVTTEEVARAQKVSANTAGLNNGFFVDAGWLQKQGRGHFIATDALLKYVQKVQFDTENAAAAAALLAETMRNSWYWQSLANQVGNGGLPRGEALVILSTEAGAGQEYKVQLDHVLNWLQYVGLIRLDEKMVMPVAAGAAAVREVRDDGAMSDDDAGERGLGDGVNDRRADGRQERKDVILAVSVDFRLTAGELATLSPEQIKALFEAVGTVAALTNKPSS
jgi:hypothetical protein